MPRMVLSMLLVVASCTTVQCRPKVTTVYLVRHAEKARVQGDDPNLTTAGRARAQALVSALEGIHIDIIFATQYRRTVQTVKPVADARSIPIRTVSASNTGVVDPIKEHNGKQILIAGHSNTVPDLIRALGVREPITINSSDYGDLFVVTIAADGTATLEKRRFDP